MAQHASQAAEFISWAGRKRRVAADRAHWPPGAAGEAPDGVHSSRTSAFQFGAITPQAPPRSGGLWCDLYSGQKAQLSLSMNKTDDILWLDAGAVMGHCAPCVWHWFHAILTRYIICFDMADLCTQPYIINTLLSLAWCTYWEHD